MAVDSFGRKDSAIASLDCLLMTREERRVEIAAEAEAAAEVMLRSRITRLVMTSMFASWSAIDDDDDDDDGVVEEDDPDTGVDAGVVMAGLVVVEPVDVVAAVVEVAVLIAVVLLVVDTDVVPGG